MSLKLTVGSGIGMQARLDEIGADCQYSFEIVKGEVTVCCDTSIDYVAEHTADYYARAFNFTRTMIDLVTFQQGLSFSLEIDEITPPKEQRKPLLFWGPGIKGLCTSYTEHSAVEMMGLVGSDPTIAATLNDLVKAISEPSAVSINCARALDGIRQHVGGHGLDPKKGWPIVRERLRVDEAYLRSIIEPSAKPRHGHRVEMGNDAADEITRRSWILMDRFIHYLKRGRQPLPPEEFPVLQG